MSTEKGEMAVGVMITVPGGSQHQYDQIAAAIFPDGELPDGTPTVWLGHEWPRRLAQLSRKREPACPAR